MKRKHIKKPIRSVKRWIKQKINNTYLEYNPPDNKTDNSKVTYFPYRENSDFFVIPKANEEYEKCEFGLPIPPKKLWLGYGDNASEYLYGKVQVEKMIEILTKSGFTFNKNDKILDFGCGAGRMIRWLKPYADTCEIWGTDISSDHIFWAKKYLRPPFHFATTTTIPHLPFADNQFSLIYAGSVFTHIDDLSDAWLLELKRILKPDGRLYITIQDKNSIELLNSIPVYKNLWLSGYINEGELLQNIKSDFGMIVGGRGFESQVFYDSEYFCESIRDIFETVSVNEEAYGFQTGILLKK